MFVHVEVVAEILFGEAYTVYSDVAECDAVDGVFVVQTVQQTARRLWAVVTYILDEDVPRLAAAVAVKAAMTLKMAAAKSIRYGTIGFGSICFSIRVGFGR